MSCFFPPHDGARLILVGAYHVRHPSDLPALDSLGIKNPQEEMARRVAYQGCLTVRYVYYPLCSGCDSTLLSGLVVPEQLSCG